jgi:hypothetical protein
LWPPPPTTVRSQPATWVRCFLSRRRVLRWNGCRSMTVWCRAQRSLASCSSSRSIVLLTLDRVFEIMRFDGVTDDFGEPGALVRFELLPHDMRPLPRSKSIEIAVKRKPVFGSFSAICSRISTWRMSFTRQRSLSATLSAFTLPRGRPPLPPPSFALARMAASAAGHRLAESCAGQLLPILPSSTRRCWLLRPFHRRP